VAAIKGRRCIFRWAGLVKKDIIVNVTIEVPYRKRKIRTQQILLEADHQSPVLERLGAGFEPRHRTSTAIRREPGN
jgi:hypothetical protein